MHRLFVLAVVCAGVMAGTPVAAHAQNRGFVGGLGGITFGTEPSSVFAGQGGVRIARQLVVFGEVGRMQNVLPDDVQDQIDEFVRTRRTVSTPPSSCSPSAAASTRASPNRYGWTSATATRASSPRIRW